MGCVVSSPHQKRRYVDPGDLDEEYVPIRYFGTNRAGSNLVPDDIDGLPSTHLTHSLPADSDDMLYEAEMDHGKAFEFIRLSTCFLLSGACVPYVAANGIGAIFQFVTCDKVCCWVRKEYSTRSFYRVYPNRIEVNTPAVRIPFGYLGCGSWNGDVIVTHPFDRGAFGFTPVRSCTTAHPCCCWPVYGGVVARHRCQCNGPVWNRMFTDCGGWWCDEWICQLMCCTYRYPGLANPDEVTFASAIALQAYFEGRPITPENMKECLEFWKMNISEQTDPVGRKRPVCCEPYIVPCCYGSLCHKAAHPKRNIPYGDASEETKEIYARYEKERSSQIRDYDNFYGPVRYSTLCRAMGCRRVFGRKGFFFCTEGCCSSCGRKAGEPAPPFEVHDIDDEWDASSVLIKVLGPPPSNVVIRRWRWDSDAGKDVLETFPENALSEGEADKDV